MKTFSLDHLSETEFEEFCYDLLQELGYKNLSWRKGTGLDGTSPDQGRDIEALAERRDLDGQVSVERWFVQCKHHKRGVPPESLQGVLT